MARYNGAGLVGRQFDFRFFGVEVGHGLFSSDLQEVKPRNRALVA
jgi:hypothetical protein